MIWIGKILSLIKYWKFGGVIILIAAFLLSAHLAKSRGERLAETTQLLETERQTFKTQLRQIEKARQDEKERNEFRKSQNKKLKLAGDDHLRDVYDFLRQRQGNAIAR